MATRFYERLNANKIRIWQVTTEFDFETVKGDISELKELIELSDGAKEQLVLKSPELAGTMPDPEKSIVENFDEVNEKKREQLQNVLDYWDMDRIPASGIEEVVDSYIDLSKINQGSGALIESFCGEELLNPASNAINGQNGNHWEHILDGPHFITIDFNYVKTIDAVRVWIPNNNAPFKLRDVVLKGSQNINQIDNEGNIIASGVDFTGDNSWAEFEFPGGNKKMRYLRMENMSTDHILNTIRIREIEVRSIVKFYDLEGTEN